MTPEEINEAREAIDFERAELRSRRLIEDAELNHKYQMLQLRCKHPDGYKYSIMGREWGWKCPDCGLNK